MDQKEFSPPPSLPDANSAQDPSSAQPWYPVSPGSGIWELHLNGERVVGSPITTTEKSVLQWYTPHARTADRIITHPFVEEVIFLDGELEDLTLGQAWGKGAYAYRHPGMRHGPYRASSEGCLMFVKIYPPSSLSP